MKTLNIKGNTKYFAAVVGLLFALGNVACNNGGGSSRSATCVAYGMPGYNPSCVNTNGIVGMPGGMVPLMTVVSSSGSQDLNMSLQIGGSGSNPPMPGMGYNGPIVIQGSMQLMEMNPYVYCGAAPGVYQVSTLQPGQMSGSSIGQMAIQATGPGGNIQFQINFGDVSVPGRLSFSSNLVVNGQPCGPLLTM
jgi:hypothetical protein